MDPIIFFIVNPGSTSTKFALFQDLDCLYEQNIRHLATDLQAAGSVIGQLPLRLVASRQALEQALATCKLSEADIDIYVGRGGLVHSLPSGTYRVNEAMLADLRAARYGEHASNLGAVIAADLAARCGKAAYIVDPPAVDEMISLARYTGLPSMHRKSAFHALNQKATARKAAASLGKDYDQCKLIVAHLGGGISVGAHLNGQVIDVNNALEEGPFSPERAGTIPALQFLDLCMSGRHDKKKIIRMLIGQGGLYAYTGNTDMQQIEKEIENHPEYREILEAMAYQIAKAIAALTAALGNFPDAVVLTGGLARSDWLISQVASRVACLGPVMVFPGENEMEALAAGTLRAIRGEQPCLEYIPEP